MVGATMDRAVRSGIVAAVVCALVRLEFWRLTCRRLKTFWTEVIIE